VVTTASRCVLVFEMTALCLVAFGCEEDRRGYCETKIDCENGTRQNLEDCKAQMDAEKATAVGCGCAEPYEAWVDCLLESGTCKTSGFILVEGEDGATWWEPIPDGEGVWVPHASCDMLFDSVIDCETYGGFDPESGGQCGG
jgi:hypothetical protein